MSIVTVLRRAFAANPHTVPAQSGEVAALQAGGIQQPVLQTYLAWRRSLLIVVVIFTALTAGLATYRALFEDEEHVDLVEELSDHFSLENLALPPVALEAKEKVREQLPDGAIPEPVRDGPAAVSEDSSAENPAEDGTAAEEDEPETAFGQFTELVELLALYALPAAAFASCLFWTRFQMSFRIMTGAFLFAFIVPMLIALCPWSWWGYEEVVFDPKTEPTLYFKDLAEGVLEGAAYMVALLPTVLSLIPGAQKACVRVKLLLPQAILPGWFLVTTSVFVSMLLLVIFVVIGQFTSSNLFLLGMLLILSAPLCYAVWANAFTRPALTDADVSRIRGVQKLIGGLTAAGGLLLLIVMQSQDIMGVRLLGWNAETAMLVPMDVVELLLETLSRSMFMTVLGADVFMLISLTEWRQSRGFAGSATARNYDGVMGEFEQLN